MIHSDLARWPRSDVVLRSEAGRREQMLIGVVSSSGVTAYVHEDSVLTKWTHTG